MITISCTPKGRTKSLSVQHSTGIKVYDESTKKGIALNQYPKDVREAIEKAITVYAQFHDVSEVGEGSKEDKEIFQPSN